MPVMRHPVQSTDAIGHRHGATPSGGQVQLHPSHLWNHINKIWNSFLSFRIYRLKPTDNDIKILISAAL